ncbi:MAG: chlorophyll synthase ChlG [Pseudomonadota bacterium]
MRASSAGPIPTFWAALELLKPITWFPPMWAFACGVVSSGAPVWDRWTLVAGGVVLAGPLVCASSQAMNDWCDRHVDAINEPDRPIPSGRLPGKTGFYIAILWSALSLALGFALGPLVLVATVVGLILAWAYSAPPLRLKLNGWWGNAACGISYEGLAWFTGAAVMLGTMPDWRILVLAALYSIGAHGIMTLNDFKSVLGDKRMGVRTLPVQLGADRAARVASIMMAVPQVVVVALLVAWGLHWFALGVAAVLGIQVWLMVRYLLDDISLLLNPRRNAALYNGTGTVFFVSGMMISAVGVSHMQGSAQTVAALTKPIITLMSGGG